MTVADYPGGYGHNDEDTNNDRRQAWQPSDLEETFTLPRGIVCPLHGGGYANHRRAPPPPPPQLAAVARRRCRSRNVAVSQSHERHEATRDDPPDVCLAAPESLSNDCHYSADERNFRLGYGWVEPGKGWTRSHHPTSCRVPPHVSKDARKAAMFGKDTLNDWFNTPSARDTAWAMSYLSREDGLPRQQRVRRNVAREHAGRRGCQHAPKRSLARGDNNSTASRQPKAAYLAETHVMQNVS